MAVNDEQPYSMLISVLLLAMYTAGTTPEHENEIEDALVLSTAPQFAPPSLWVTARSEIRHCQSNIAICSTIKTIFCTVFKPLPDQSRPKTLPASLYIATHPQTVAQLYLPSISAIRPHAAPNTKMHYLFHFTSYSKGLDTHDIIDDRRDSGISLFEARPAGQLIGLHCNCTA